MKFYCFDLRTRNKEQGTSLPAGKGRKGLFYKSYIIIHPINFVKNMLTLQKQKSFHSHT